MKEIKNIEQVAEYVRSLRVILDDEYEKFDNATTYAEELAEVEYAGLSSANEDYLSAIRDVFDEFNKIDSELNDLYEKMNSIRKIKKTYKRMCQK